MPPAPPRVVGLAAFALVGALSLGGCSSSRPVVLTAGTAQTAPAPASTDPAGAGSDMQQAFLYSDPSGVVFVRWTRSGNTLDAVVDVSKQGASITGGDLHTTGTVDGNAVTLQVNGTAWTGTLSGDELLLHLPVADGSLTELTMKPGSIDDYNAAVAGLHSAATSAAQASAAAQSEAQAQQAATSADSTLASDLDRITSAITDLTGNSVFTNDIQAMNNDLTTMRTDLATTQSDASTDCAAAGGDASGVAGDFSGLQGSDSGLEGTISVATSSATSLNKRVSETRADLATLDAAASAAGVTPQHTRADVDAAAALATTALAASQRAIDAARAQAKSLLATGAQIRDQAAAVANGCH